MSSIVGVGEGSCFWVLMLKTQDLTGWKFLDLSFHYSCMWDGDYPVPCSKEKTDLVKNKSPKQ